MRQSPAIVVLTLGLIAAPATMTAQIETGGPINDGCGVHNGCGSGHKMVLGGELYMGVHHDCMFCVAGPSFEACHPPCAETFADAADAHAYKALLKAAREGDLTTTVRLAAEVPGFAAFNPERRSLQIASCQRDRIIANVLVPINSPLLKIVAGLPRFVAEPARPAVFSKEQKAK
jgi:hypothetical protein